MRRLAALGVPFMSAASFHCPGCGRGYFALQACDWCPDTSTEPAPPRRTDRLSRHAGLRAWRLEFDCDGSRFVWAGCADNQSAAETVARADLACDQPDFAPATARLVACLER